MRRNVLEVKDLVRNYRKSVIKESEDGDESFLYGRRMDELDPEEALV